METKANHLAVGTFVLVVVLGLTGFALWLGKAEIDREFDAYDIYFSGSVSGLSVASTVRYRGVPVGTVTVIRIDPDNSERVLVTIEATTGTPIKEDAVAALEMQGITGLVDVQITGGSKNSPLLVAKEGEPLPVIASVQTKLEELFEDVPNLLARATVLIERGTELLNEENLDAIADTLANVRRFTGGVADSTADLESLSADVASIAASVRSTADEIDVLVGELRERVPGLVDDAATTLNVAGETLATLGISADALATEARSMLARVREDTGALTTDARSTLRHVGEAAENLAATAETLNRMIAENRQPLQDFSRDGLYELSRFLVEARELVASLTRIADRFESDPAQFMFGDSQAGYEPQ